MRSYEEISNRIMERGDEIIESRRIRATKIKHTSYAVSGLCAAVITGVGIWHMSLSAPKRNNKPGDSDIIISTETTSEKTASSSIIVTTATGTSSVYKTKTATTSLKTTSVYKATTSTETSSVSAAATAKPTASAVSSEIINSTTVTNSSTETLSSNDNSSTQTTSSTASENVTSSETDTTTTTSQRSLTTTTHRPPIITTKPPDTTTCTPKTTTTTTITSYRPMTTTATTAPPTPDNAIEKEVSVKAAIKDIDTGEYISGTLTLFRSYSAGHRAILQSFTIGAEPYETVPEIITFYKGGTAQIGISISNLPSGYELVQEDPDNYDYYNKYVEISETQSGVSEIVFYVRKLAD